MPPVKQQPTTAPSADDSAEKLAAAEKAVAERDARIVELEQQAKDAEAKATARSADDSAEDRGELGKYVVLSAGAAYNDPDGNPRLALRRRVIDIDAVEAARLIGLGAVKAAGDDDLAYEDVERERELANLQVVAPEGSANPYGGKALQDLDEHAAQEIAKAQAAAVAAAQQ
jgi:hypothetical protein